MSHYGSSYGPSRGTGHDSYRYAPYSMNGSGSGGGGSGMSSSYRNSRYSQSSGNLGYGGSGGGGRYSSSHYSNSSSSLMGGSGYGSRSRGGRGGPKSEFGISYGQAGSSLRSVDWSQQDLPPFQKNFYREASTVTSMTDEDVNRWRKEKDMTVLGKDIPRPVRTFEEAGFPEYIMAEIRRAGFSAPTPIQSQGWPMAMSGRDIVGIARTGSGKTLGFLLPSIVHINAQPLLRPNDGPIVLIIAPTRELAVQIEGEARKFASSSKIKHTCVYGGVPRREQIRVLKSGVEIVICTPGRLLDFLESGTTNLRRVTYLVIDEADRLLDMGFEPQLKAIMSQVRPDKQILMWSATWPEEVRVLAHDFLKGEILQVAIGSFDVSANEDVTQVIEVMSQYDKQGRLFQLLREYLEKTTVESPTKILVFTATKRTCDSLTRMLKTDEWPATSIHGDKQQYDRDQALSDFKHGKCPIMLATDVASRGIHVDDITVVINFDMPGNIEDYVHRIGRTGRCGKKGIAISFFTRDDAKRAPKLINILEKANQRVPPELRSLRDEYGSTNGRRGGGRRGGNSNNYRSGGGGGSSSSSSHSSKYNKHGSSSSSSSSSLHGLPPASHSNGSRHTNTHTSGPPSTTAPTTQTAPNGAMNAYGMQQPYAAQAYNYGAYNAAAYAQYAQYAQYAAHTMNPATMASMTNQTGAAPVPPTSATTASAVPTPTQPQTGAAVAPPVQNGTTNASSGATNEQK